MRLFIAVEFNGYILGTLKRIQGEMKKAGCRGRYTKEENLHLTLAFIGEYDDPDKVIEAMKAARFKPFDIELSGSGHFGNLYWAGLKKNPELEAYAERLRKGLSDKGIPFDKKKFSPHITLMRDAEFAGRGPKIDGAKMRVEKISLIKSEFTGKGMKYTVIGEVR